MKRSSNGASSPTPAKRARMQVEAENEYWNAFYKSMEAPSEGSTFSSFVLPILKSTLSKSDVLVELGCGNGRDSRALASHGIRAIGLDLAQASIEALRAKDALSLRPSLATWIHADFTNLPETYFPKELSIGAVYSRFTLHSVDKAGASRALKWMSKILRPGGLFLIEVRSIKDQMYGKGTPVADDPDAWINTHYRRFIRKDDLKAELLALGFVIEQEAEAGGLSVWRGDDPVLIRLVARKTLS